MHHLISRPWRHRLLALHVAAGAGALGAGGALWAWSGKGLAGTDSVTAVVVAHLALAIIVLGLIVLGRSYRRVFGRASETSRAHERKRNDA